MSNLHANHLPPLWSWQELSAGLTGRRVAGPDVYRVTIDSRQAQPGDLFLALPGDPGNRFNPSHRSTVDGHDFVEAAAKKRRSRRFGAQEGGYNKQQNGAAKSQRHL